jgi:hypothetical protein
MTIVTCEYCHFTYDNQLKQDYLDHNKIHDEFDKVELERGCLPESHGEREKSKKFAYALMADGLTLEERVQGTLMLIKAHFDRSFEKAIYEGYWKEHPRLDGYVAMVEYGGDILSGDVLEVLRAKYGRRAGPIPIGETYWYPKMPEAIKSR